MTETTDPMEFIVPASDNQGHSARHWFRSNPQMSRQVEQMVSGKKFPYRTKGDLLRHALARHLRWLTTQGGVTSITTQVDLMIDIMRDEEMNSDFLTVFDKLSSRISVHVSSGAEGEAIRLVRLIQQHISGMPEGYWRSRYEDEVRLKFGHLITNGHKAKLGLIDD